MALLISDDLACNLMNFDEPLFCCCKFHSHSQVVNPSTPPTYATVGPVVASVGAAVVDSLLNVSQAGAGYNTQIAPAKSLPEVTPQSFYS